MIANMIQSYHSHHGLNTTRGYDRKISSGEVALFLALLVLPFALLAAQSI
jgi:hypothetical protein